MRKNNELNNNNFEGSPIIPVPDVLDTPCPISDMVDKVKLDAEYDKRKQDVELYNKVN